MLEPYAITTARRLIASMWRSQDTQRQEELDDVIAAASASAFPVEVLATYEMTAAATSRSPESS